MGKTYVSPSGTAKELKKVYFGDSNNLAKSVNKIYIGDQNSIARMVYSTTTPPTPIIQTYLFKDGQEKNQQLSGGWSTQSKGYSSLQGSYTFLSKPTINNYYTKTDKRTTISLPKYTTGPYGYAGIYKTNNYIDLTLYNSIITNASRTGYYGYLIIIDPNNDTISRFYNITTLKEYELDITMLSGNYTLAFYVISSKTSNTRIDLFDLYLTS